MGVKEFGLGDLIEHFCVFRFVSVVIKGRSCYSNDYVTIQIIIHGCFYSNGFFGSLVTIKVDVNGHLNGHVT